LDRKSNGSVKYPPFIPSLTKGDFSAEGLKKEILVLIRRYKRIIEEINNLK